VAAAVSTSDPIGELLRARSVVILDGALATELEARGADLSDPLWSAKCLLERPELIRQVHLDYFRAGAQVATTATYQATFEGFAQRGIERGRAARLMLEAVSLARVARDEFRASLPSGLEPRPLLIAASVGPYGAMRADGSEYRGRYGLSDRELAEFHRPRLEVLARSGADVLAFETLPCLQEALVLAKLLDEYPGITAWLCFSCRDGTRNSEGEDMGSCAQALSRHPRIAAIGVNCTAPEHVPKLLERMRELTAKPLVAYPNSGERYDAEKKRWVGPAAHASTAQARQWVAAGARLVGGCCRTTPADIRGLSEAFG
jgi:homocysteine S-methyltransferase